MPPDEQGKSPFAPADSPQSEAPPEPPRLGISHLLILTACVAVYLGLARTMAQVAQGFPGVSVGFSSDVVEAVPGALNGIGSGAALAGIVLLIARRWRGLRFPVHPGEYLLVLMGFGTVIGWAATITALLAYGSQRASVSIRDISVFLIVSNVVSLLLYAAAWLWTVVRVKSWRWRVFFLAMPATYVLGTAVLLVLVRAVAPSTAVKYALLSHALPRLLGTIILAVVMLKDHLDGKRYPWTHWFGVATRVWIDVSTAGAAVWYALLAA